MNPGGHEHNAVGMNASRLVGRRGFLWPFLAATSPTMMTIPAGIGTVISGVGVVYALQMASAVLGALPLVFVFLLAQRQIVEGVAGTGLK